jgi:hypothetical protein
VYVAAVGDFLFAVELECGVNEMSAELGLIVAGIAILL